MYHNGMYKTMNGYKVYIVIIGLGAAGMFGHTCTYRPTDVSLAVIFLMIIAACTCELFAKD